MLLKLIACNVFQREACLCIAQSPHVIDPEFTELGAHTNAEALRAILQAHIDAAEHSPKRYEAVLLLFGLCGNTTVGLQAHSIPVVMPRAHDCCTILLGSREAFKEHFGDAPSTPFSSAGYMERGDYYLRMEEGEAKVYYGDAYAEYVEKYGEENARYIWETMHPDLSAHLGNRAVFIDLPETAHLGHAERFRTQAEAEGKEVVILPGSLRLICGLMNGDWNPEEYLIVPPGHKTVGVYDWTEVIRAVA